MLALAGGIAAQEAQGPFKPNVRYATFSFPGLEVHVPAAHVDRLAPVAAQAAAVYARMQGDSGWTPSRTLHLVLTDDEDAHNGFSTVVPFPLVNVQLGPTRPESGLFAGDDEWLRTFVHELGHHLSNDRNHGWRAALETLFGRVMPSEPLSLAVFLLSTPNHVLSPAFWHEGVAQWAETAYADPASAWGGRGRDSLSHMVWRLDAAAGGIPAADTWRLDHHTYPFGNRAYLYGLAYTRWLAGAFGDRRGLWRMVEAQSRLATPFAFQGGARAALGFGHEELIPLARAALQSEQEAALAQIRSMPVTTVPRLTPRQWRVAAPAWLDDGRLLHAGDPPHGQPALRVTALQPGSFPSWATRWADAWLLGNARRVAAGLAVQADAEVGADRWERSRVRLLADGGVVQEWADGRLIQPDARRQGDGFVFAAVRLDGAGAQSLVLSDGRTVASQGRPWSPTFRPGHDEVCFVETDQAGSRLVLAGLDGGNRRVLWQVRGRILHPVWDAAGARLFCASDVSGVANAWCVTVAPASADPDGGLPSAVQPVTNVIGGVLAAVPSPDGTRLAILDHDADGPFIGVIPLDPATWPAALPQVLLPWPAPVERRALGSAATGEDRADPPPLVVEPGPLPTSRPYSGLASLRPRFWTPTTYAVPEGGLGAVAVGTDALLTHQVVASAGLGYHERTPVGLAAWTYSGWNPGLALIAKRAELGYDQQVPASDGNAYDYAETVDTVEGRIGYGLGGYGRRWQAWLAAGIDRHAAVESATDDYAGLLTGGPVPFTGSERYVELTVAYDDSLLFPTSYAREDGLALALSARAGEERGNRVLAQAAYALAVWPSAGHQLVGAGRMGWSDGPSDLQGRFGVGGDEVLGDPRGYPLTMERGRCLESWSLAYRLPVWRPFHGSGTTPLVTRQAVLEGFYDAARVGDRLEEGRWYRTAGAELRLDLAFWLVRFSPGMGLARQIDGAEDTTTYLTLGFRW